MRFAYAGNEENGSQKVCPAPTEPQNGGDSNAKQALKDSALVRSGAYFRIDTHTGG